MALGQGTPPPTGPHLQGGPAGPTTVFMQGFLACSRAELQQLLPLQFMGDRQARSSKKERRGTLVMSRYLDTRSRTEQGWGSLSGRGTSAAGSRRPWGAGDSGEGGE